jgi:hypothetical protein
LQQNETIDIDEKRQKLDDNPLSSSSSLKHKQITNEASTSSTTLTNAKINEQSKIECATRLIRMVCCCCLYYIIYCLQINTQLPKDEQRTIFNCVRDYKNSTNFMPLLTVIKRVKQLGKMDIVAGLCFVILN